MAVSIPSFSSKFLSEKKPSRTSPDILFRRGSSSRIVAMAPKKVNRYDPDWKKQWYGAGIFAEGSEEVEVDVLKKIEKRKVLSGVEKAGLLSKAEDFGFTLSSIEKLGFLSKAEELGLLGLVERAAAFSPAALASVSLPLAILAVASLVAIPDDSLALVALQTTLAVLLGAGAAGLLVGSIVLGGPSGVGLADSALEG